MPKNFIIFLVLTFIAQLLVWFQSNAQFLWHWATKRDLLLAILGVIPSLLFIKGMTYGYIYFNNQLWPMRFFSFTLGIIIFSVLSWIMMGEPITMKTIVCLSLCFLIVLVQIFWV